MTRLLLSGLSVIGHGAIATAHVCECAARVPNLSLLAIAAAVGYVLLALLQLVPFLRLWLKGRTEESEHEAGG